MIPISGKSKLIGFVGDPVEQARSPQALNARYRQKGMDCVVVPLKVPAEQLDDALRMVSNIKNFLGCIITIPHKRAALRSCGRLSQQAQLTGLINAIRWYPEHDGFADQFDGLGFVAGLHQANVTLEGVSAFINGAGGAGRAIAFALAEAGVDHLCIYDIDYECAAELTVQLTEFMRPDFAKVAAYPEPDQDLLINASPVGMRSEDPFPIAVDVIPQGAVLADVIMAPAKTAWLAAGEKRGHRVVQGLSMLDGQIDALEAFFTTAYHSHVTQ